MRITWLQVLNPLLPDRLLVAICVCVGLLLQIAPAPAADNGLTSAEKDALLNACRQSGNLCMATCAHRYPASRTSVSQSLSKGFCEDDCNASFAKCKATIASRGAGAAPTAGNGGGGVLDPGTGNAGGAGGPTTGQFGTRLQKGASP